MVSSLSSPRSLAFSAFGSGSLRSLVVRRSLSGSRFVLVASFGSASAAGAFARRWSVRLGRSVLVRRVSSSFSARVGAFWAVSVPCALAPAAALGCAWAVARVSFVGGLRRLVRSLALSRSVWGAAGG